MRELTSGVKQPMKLADMVLLNGKIVTVDAKRPEAEALAIH
jgi:predicted amidohydrolase YtcJ